MWMLVHPTHLVLSNATLSNEIFCGSFLVKKLVICVPSTPAKWISFHKHRNRKVVGGKHNILVHYADAITSNLSGVVLSNPFRWDICGSFLIKNLVVCVPSKPAKWISFHNHMNRKVVGGKHNVLVYYKNASAPDSSGVVHCNSIILDILWFILFENLVFLCLPH